MAASSVDAEAVPDRAPGAAGWFILEGAPRALTDTGDCHRMSERTTASLAILDTLLPALEARPQGEHRDRIVEEAQALRRAVSAFHMEAIRFRMYSVDRLLRLEGEDGAARQMFEQLRQALEEAGFHTRSHTAP